MKAMYPNISLPPTPIITRWGSWIEAAEYYSEYFYEIKTVLNEFDEDDSEAIKESKKLFRNFNLKENLTFIKANFRCIRLAITNLESRGLTVIESLNILQSVREAIGKLHDQKYYNKMESILRRNTGYSHIVEIGEILQKTAPLAVVLLINFLLSKSHFSNIYQ